MYLTDDEIETLVANVAAIIGLVQGKVLATQLPTAALEAAHEMGALEHEDPTSNLIGFIRETISQVGSDNVASALGSLVTLGVLEVNTDKFFELYEIEQTNEVH